MALLGSRPYFHEGPHRPRTERQRGQIHCWLAPQHGYGFNLAFSEENVPVDVLTFMCVHNEGATHIIAVLAGIIALVVAIIGICGVVRLRQRYKGNAPTGAHPKVDEYSINHLGVTYQRILM